MTHRKDEDPPKPPPFQRHIAIAPVQGVGVGLLVLIVAAALTGWLGLKPGQADASVDKLQVHVDYPRVMRYKTSMPLDIRVANASSDTIPELTVRIDRAYLDNFQNVQFTPGPDRVTASHYELNLGALPAGQARHVVAWLEAHARGSKEARLEVTAGSGVPLDLRWSTVFLP